MPQGHSRSLTYPKATFSINYSRNIIPSATSQSAQYIDFTDAVLKDYPINALHIVHPN